MKKILEKVSLYKEILIVFSGTVFSGFFNFLFFSLLGKNFDVSTFGRINYIIEIINMIIIISDVGLTIGYIKFNTRYILEGDKEKSNKLTSIVFIIKIIVSLIMFLGILILSFVNQGLGDFQTILLIGSIIFCTTIYNYCIAIFQSLEFFIKFSLFKVFSPLFKLLLLLLVIGFNFKSEKMILIIVGLAPLISFLIAIKVLPLDLSLERKNNKFYKILLRDLFNFSKWVIMTNLLVSFISRLDLLMLQSMSSPLELGYYSAAQKLCLLVPLLTKSLTTVLLPKASKINKRMELKRYFLYSYKIIVLLLIPIILIIMNMKFIVSLTFGSDYIANLLVFKVLLLIFMFEMILTPVMIIFYTEDLTKWLILINVAILIINYIGNTVLILKLGALGAAYSTLIARIIGLIMFSYVSYYKIIKLNMED